MFQDAMRALLGVLECLHVENIITKSFDNILNSNTRVIVEILSKEFSNDSLEEYDLQSDLKSVLCMIGRLAEEELLSSKEEQGEIC